MGSEVGGSTRLRDRTTIDLSLLIVRVVAGVIFAAHGGQKMFGWWGGPGLEAVVQNIPPWPLGYFVAVGEFFGGIGLILGFLSRFSAASLIAIMIGAIVRVHGPNGFFQANMGFEYNLALIGLLAPTLLAGPGAFAIGPWIMPKSKNTGRPVIVLE